MKVLFMGTPDFAVESLRALISAKHQVCGVVCQPDKPKGRGNKMAMPPVKEEALACGIPVYQPNTLKNGELKPVLEKEQPDVIAVAAYGKLLPAYVLDMPRYGCVNVHGSVLPKYRGAAPIQWAVINGEKETGITTMQMNQGLDTGDILLIKKTAIGPEETAEQLFERLAVLGGQALLETLDGLENGSIHPVPQNHEESTYAPMISKAMAQIDWTKGKNEILNLIRGMNSWPMAYTTYEGQLVKVIRAEAAEGSGTPGSILGVVKQHGLKVACGDGAVVIRELQFAG